MKVVQINAVCGIGSTGRICTDIADALITEGHECKIIYGNGISDYLHGVKVSNKWLVKLNALRARITGNDMSGCYISTFRIIRFLKQYKPDVVHLHNLHAHYVNLPILCNFLAKHDIPTVITLHDCWFYTGGCTHYTAAKCYRWQDYCHNCPGYTNGTKYWFTPKSSSILKQKRKSLLQIPRLYIVGCSRWIVNEAIQSINYGEFYQIYNGIKLTQFYPTHSNFNQLHGAQDCKLILGFANKWLQRTNKTILDNTLSSLNEKQRLVIVGCKKEQINLLSSYENKVIALPYISNVEELREIYSSCTIFVNLSREDTLPTVNLEAQACGLPIMALNKTGITETVCKDTGEVLERITATSIMNFLTKVSNKNKSTIIEQNRNFIKFNFTFDDFVDKYIKLYKNIVSS